MAGLHRHSRNHREGPSFEDLRGVAFPKSRERREPGIRYLHPGFEYIVVEGLEPEQAMR